MEAGIKWHVVVQRDTEIQWLMHVQKIQVKLLLRTYQLPESGLSTSDMSHLFSQSYHGFGLIISTLQ